MSGCKSDADMMDVIASRFLFDFSFPNSFGNFDRKDVYSSEALRIIAYICLLLKSFFYDDIWTI